MSKIVMMKTLDSSFLIRCSELKKPFGVKTIQFQILKEGIFQEFQVIT